MDDVLEFATPPPDSPPTAERAAYPLRNFNRSLFLLLAIVTAALDLVTKGWAERALRVRSGSMPVVDGVVRLVVAHNPGAFWSLFGDAPAVFRAPVLVGIGVLATLALVWMHTRIDGPVALRWGIPLVLGGAVGNLADRIRHGYVVDFIDVSARFAGRLVHWPTFNVADIAISVGIGLMLVGMRRRDNQHGSASSEPP